MVLRQLDAHLHLLVPIGRAGESPAPTCRRCTRRSTRSCVTLADGPARSSACTSTASK
jgi:hypothetical protein